MPLEFWTVAISVGGSVLTAFGVAWLTMRGQRPVTLATANREHAAAAAAIVESAADVSTASGEWYDRLSKRLSDVEAMSARQGETLASQANTIAEQSAAMATMKSQQIENVAQIGFLTERVATLTTGVRVLSAQIVEMGGLPKWADPTEPKEGAEYGDSD